MFHGHGTGHFEANWEQSPYIDTGNGETYTFKDGIYLMD